MFPLKNKEKVKINNNNSQQIHKMIYHRHKLTINKNNVNTQMMISCIRLDKYINM